MTEVVHVRSLSLAALLLGLVVAGTAAAQPVDVDALKSDAIAGVEARVDLVQEIVDTLFSFAEPGFQEFETQEYLTTILADSGFEVELGVAGIPSAWVATWTNGTGGPVISLNSDVDALPGLSQMPGVTEQEAMVEGGPGHSEGHNTGMGGVVVAALVLQEIMQKQDIAGTLHVWPGVAEEILASKAYMVRAGVFDDVDVVLSTHVSSRLSTGYGRSNGTGLVSVIYEFEGTTSHAAVAPWSGRSAADAVELMNVGINYRREHFRTTSRTHYVILEAGDQPNIVPDFASVWYYFREVDPENIRENFEVGNRIAEAAAMMTDTIVTHRVVGAAWPSWNNQPVAEAMQANIEAVGMPEWSEADIAYAKAVQTAIGRDPVGLVTEVGEIGLPAENPTGGPSDDIGDVTWTVPTVRLSYPSNIPGTIVHQWTAALASATPIAHKGAAQSAKVLAMTALDLLTDPELVAEAWAYFNDVQNQEIKYESFLGEGDEPAIDMNEAMMSELRPLLEEFHYDAEQYDTYLEQLGIEWGGE